MRWESYNEPGREFFYMHRRLERFGSWSVAWTQTAVALETLLSSFKFFPVFLLIGYVGYAVNRHREFQRAMYVMRGGFADCGQLTGASILDIHDPSTQDGIFLLYRYLL